MAGGDRRLKNEAARGSDAMEMDRESTASSGRDAEAVGADALQGLAEAQTHPLSRVLAQLRHRRRLRTLLEERQPAHDAIGRRSRDCEPA